MKNERNHKDFTECFYEFMSDPENLTQDELRAELTDMGIYTDKLEKRITEIVKKGSAERRLAWLRRARERRGEIEKKLDSMQLAGISVDLKNKIKKILAGSHGQVALSIVEAYFRKIDSLSEKDLKSMIEDIERLNYLEEISKKENE
jgi:ABC-type phosphate transport system auxiliary subunit